MSVDSETLSSEEFRRNLDIADDGGDGVKEEVQENGTMEDEEEEEEEEEEFSFICEVAASSPISAEDAFINGQIKPVFPLFNRDLLFSGEDYDNLPMRPPVKKVFVETTTTPQDNNNNSGSSQAATEDGSNRKAVEASPEICKKSNSTGFSKIWRFKEFLGRSNSDGRDAFVFLNKEPPVKKELPSSSSSTTTAIKVKAAKKGKAVPLSAHEVYLKNKAKEDDRRRSFLPYRPELMGFFTSVNGGGLSKNLHPY